MQLRSPYFSASVAHVIRRYALAALCLFVMPVLADQPVVIRDNHGALIYTISVNGSKSVVRDRHGALVATETTQRDGVIIIRDRSGRLIAKINPHK